MNHDKFLHVSTAAGFLTVPLRSQPLCVLLSLPCPCSHGRLAATACLAGLYSHRRYGGNLGLVGLRSCIERSGWVGWGMAGWLDVRVGSCHIYKKMRTMTQSCSLWLNCSIFFVWGDGIFWVT